MHRASPASTPADGGRDAGTSPGARPSRLGLLGLLGLAGELAGRPPRPLHEGSVHLSDDIRVLLGEVQPHRLVVEGETWAG